MADIKVSALGSAAPSQLADELYVARAGTSLKATVQNILAALTLLTSGAPAALADEFLSVRAGAAQKLTLQNALTLLGQNSARRNILIGGNFDNNPWQDGTSFVSPATGSYTADMWQWVNTGPGAVTITKSADAPTVAAAGKFIQNCMLVDVTTSDAAVAAGDLAGIRIRVEGYNWITGAQRACVLKFWHKHTKIGTYCVSLRSTGADRTAVFEYTQAVTDVWEEAAIDVPASPSAGTWDYINGIGLHLDFTVYGGATFQTTAGAWNVGDFRCTANQVNGMDNTANNFRVADIRFYPGTIADGAVRVVDRSADEELELCFRYYKRFSADASNAIYVAQGTSNSTSTSQMLGSHLGPMRILPAVLNSAIGDCASYDGATATALTALTVVGTASCFNFAATVAGTPLTVSRVAILQVSVGAGKYVALNARL